MSLSCIVRSRRRLISACLILFGIGLNAPAAQAPLTPVNGSTVELRIQRIQDGLLSPVLVQGESTQKTKLRDRMSALHVPGVSIAVIHDGQIDWARGFGVTKSDGPPVTPNTLFQAASISKPVTAMAVLHLAESGKLNLDADVNQYLKSWKIPASSFMEQSGVTLQKLLSHTAGMTVHGFAGYASDEPVPNLVQVLNGGKPANSAPILVNTVPGTMWRYSGGGYVVIQQVLEDVTGQPFAKLMQDIVLRPVGMAQSTYEQPLPQGRLANAAMPYSRDGQGIKGGPHVYPEMAAAGLWTTPSDLARYAIDIQKSLAGEPTHVLSTEMARKMLRVVLQGYSLGLGIGGSEKRPYFSHGGANAGFQCNLVVYNTGDGAVIMTNSDSGSQLAAEILRTIAYEYGWPDFQPMKQKETTVSPKILERYVGIYELAPKVNIMITLEGGQLMAQRSGQGKLPLFASSETKFFSKVVDVEIEFGIDDKGVVTHMVLHQSGRETKALRTSDKVVERKEVTISPDILAKYVGNYELRPGFDLVITLEGNQLMSQATGQSKIPLFAESERKFFLNVVDADIEFLKNDNGEVTSLMLHQGAAEIKAARK
jgi:CubicO group peptidase (beta-lactamase class C family)